MGIKELSKNLRSQSIVRLRLNNKTIGLRCIRYFPDAEQFSMYDFYLEDASGNKKLYEFLKGISSKLAVAELHKVGDQYVTDEEQRLGIQAQELSDVREITKIVEPLVLFYKRGYLKAS